jgi:hypothetical protein
MSGLPCNRAHRTDTMHDATSADNLFVGGFLKLICFACMHSRTARYGESFIARTSTLRVLHRLLSSAK